MGVYIRIIDHVNMINFKRSFKIVHKYMDIDPQADNAADNKISNIIIITKFKVNHNFKYFILISVSIIFEFYIWVRQTC